MRGPVEPRRRRGFRLLAAVCCTTWLCGHQKIVAEDTGTTTQHIASVDGGMEAAIDAPWRLEPDPLSSLRYPKIPIIVSIHDAGLQYDAETQVRLGQFCEMAIQEDPDQGPPPAPEYRTASALNEIERSDVWLPVDVLAANHRRCRPASGQVCPSDLELDPPGADKIAEWHGTVLYTPRNQTPGADVHLTVQVRVARRDTACGAPKPIVLDYPPFDRFRPHPHDANSYVVVNRLTVHLGEEPLPRFDEGWVYGDLHYHSQGTDNEGESAYAYRPTLQAMRAMGLDFLFATEHASDSMQTTDIDMVYLRNIDLPWWVPFGSDLEDLIEKIPGALESNQNAARDMSPHRFGYLLSELNGSGGGNAEVMKFPGRSRAPRIFLGGEVDVMPEMSAAEKSSGHIAYGNGRFYNWRSACTPDGFSLLSLIRQHSTSALCDSTDKLAVPAPDGRYFVKDLQGFSDSFTARQHMIHLPTDGTRFDAFVSGKTGPYGGATQALGPATAPPGQEGFFPGVLYQDYAVGNKGYLFLAHPVDAESGNGIGRLGPDIVPYSDVQLKTAFSSPSFLGLQLWNEDSRLRSSTAYQASMPGFPLQHFDGASSTLSRWLWRHWFGPEPPTAYAALHDGLVAWDRMLLWGMRPSQTAALDWLPAGEPRRVFMAGGSDAHGDWNYRREGRLGGVSAIVDTAIGKPRNLVYVGPDRPETVFGPPPVAQGFAGGDQGTSAAYGAVAQEQVTTALASGNFAVTDGPALRIAIDTNANYVIDEEDVLMGGSTNTPYRGTAVPFIVEWKSTPEFGPLASIDLYVGVTNDGLDDGLVYAAPNHGVHSSSTPSGAVSPNAYIDGNGASHQELMDGYMLDPTDRLHIILNGGSMEGRRHVFLRANDYPVGRRRFVEAQQGQCTPNHAQCAKPGHANDEGCEWECTPSTPASWDFVGPTLPDRMFLRAFARTAPTAGALCSQEGDEAYKAAASGQCIERLAFTNPIWVDNKVAPPPPGAFSVTCGPTTLASGGTSTCTVTSLGGFSKAVSFGCSSLPSSASCSFQPATVTPPANGTASTTLTVSAGLAPTGSYGFRVKGAVGLDKKTVNMVLDVGGAGGGGDGGGNSVFDAKRRAPFCEDAVGGACSTGLLVFGRSAAGREPNASNTIGGSCEDGASGPRSGEWIAVDRIQVTTADGTRFAPGAEVRIDATVSPSSTPSADAVDFFYAANADEPEWTLIETVVPTVEGKEILSVVFTLPAGEVQAVRVQYREQNSSGWCAPGDVNDRDDLIFAVTSR